MGFLLAKNDPISGVLAYGLGFGLTVGERRRYVRGVTLVFIGELIAIESL